MKESGSKSRLVKLIIWVMTTFKTTTRFFCPYICWFQIKSSVIGYLVSKPSQQLSLSSGRSPSLATDSAADFFIFLNTQIHICYFNNRTLCWCLISPLLLIIWTSLCLFYATCSFLEYIRNLGANFEEGIGTPLGMLPWKPEDSRP